MSCPEAIYEEDEDDPRWPVPIDEDGSDRVFCD